LDAFQRIQYFLQFAPDCWQASIFVEPAGFGAIGASAFIRAHGVAAEAQAVETSSATPNPDFPAPLPLRLQYHYHLLIGGLLRE